MIDNVRIKAESKENPPLGLELRMAKFSDKKQDSNNTIQKIMPVNVNLNLPIYNSIERDKCLMGIIHADIILAYIYFYIEH